jgi:hypothetical protein
MTAAERSLPGAERASRGRPRHLRALLARPHSRYARNQKPITFGTNRNTLLNITQLPRSLRGKMPSPNM